MANKSFDLLGIGDPFLDLVIEVDQLPKTNTNCPMKQYCFQGGGNVPTALVAASRLGLTCSLIGSVGDDLFGKMSLSDLAYNGVDTSNMIIDSGKKSNFSVCVTESAIEGKEFISNHGDFRTVGVEEIDAMRELFMSTRLLHTGLISPATVRACEYVHAGGGKVSIDAPYHRPHVYKNYRHFDIFIGSEMYYDEFCRVHGLKRGEFEKNMKHLQGLGPEIVIFTFGGDGAKGVYEDNYFDIPAKKVSVVDTTGAGDVFHGAFDYAYLQGWDVKTCAEFATCVSAIKCTRPGGRAGIPTLPVLMSYMETGEIDYSEIDRRVAHYQSGMDI